MYMTSEKKNKKNVRGFYAAMLLLCTMAFFWGLTQYSAGQFIPVNIFLMALGAGFGSASFFSLIDPKG